MLHLSKVTVEAIPVYEGGIDITDVLGDYSFSVAFPDGTTKIYQIDEHNTLTWEEWIDSEYNTDGFYLNSATDPEVIIGRNLGEDGEYCYLTEDGSFVLYDSIVQGGYAYGYKETDYNG